MTQDQTPDRPERRPEPADGETERLDAAPEGVTERLDGTPEGATERFEPEPAVPASAAEPTGEVGAAGSTRAFDEPGPYEAPGTRDELAPEAGADGLPGGGGAAGGPGWQPPGPPGAPPGAGPGGHAVGAGRRWRRSTQSRVIAGVAGGLGEYTGVDPVLFRVLFAVLALPVFGWVGLLLYLVAWLVLPDGEEEGSLAEAVLGRNRAGNSSNGRGMTQSVEGLVLAVLAGLLLVLLVRGDLSDGGDVVLVVLLGLGGWLLLRQRGRVQRGRVQSPPGMPPGPPPGEASFQATAAAPYTAQYTRPAGPLPYERPAGPPSPPAPRERSVLGRLTLSAAVLVCGVLGLLDATGVLDPAPRQYLAAAVATLGLGLVVGTLLGRARWLAWIAFPLTGVMILAALASAAVRGGTGDFTYAPTSVAALQGEYTMGVGTLTLDLSQIDFRNQSVATTIRANVGDIRITVPDNVDVTVEAHVAAGDLMLFGTDNDGLNQDRTVTDLGPDGTGGGTLTIDVDMSLGQVEVDREAA
jgi:phage shock protein PspC (stress-responsive transcriptional regulator)